MDWMRCGIAIQWKTHVMRTRHLPQCTILWIYATNQMWMKEVRNSKCLVWFPSVWSVKSTLHTLSCAELDWWAPLCREGQGPGVTPEMVLGSWPCSSLWHGSWLQDCVLFLNIYWDLHLRNLQLPVYIVYFHEKCFLKAAAHEGNIMKFSEPQNRWWMTTDMAQLRNTKFSGTEMQPGLHRRVPRGQRTFVMKCYLWRALQPGSRQTARSPAQVSAIVAGSSYLVWK